MCKYAKMLIIVKTIKTAKDPIEIILIDGIKIDL